MFYVSLCTLLFLKYRDGWMTFIFVFIGLSKTVWQWLRTRLKHCWTLEEKTCRRLKKNLVLEVHTFKTIYCNVAIHLRIKFRKAVRYKLFKLFFIVVFRDIPKYFCTRLYWSSHTEYERRSNKWSNGAEKYPSPPWFQVLWLHRKTSISISWM